MDFWCMNTRPNLELSLWMAICFLDRPLILGASLHILWILVIISVMLIF